MDMYDTGYLYDRLRVLEREEISLGRRERLSSMERPLLVRCSSRARSLPQRDDPKPYRVWISEIMLQQTRVEAVKPYFGRFMETFPTVSHLAQAEDDRLMKMWGDLGYYNRARNLKAATRMIMSEYGGRLPASSDELIRLPRVGSCITGAIASIAHGIPLPTVNGNVLRVMPRVLGDREDIEKASVKAGIEAELEDMMPRDEASHYNQGLVEIGALVCIPDDEPRCSQCPLTPVCLTRKNGRWKEIPYKSPDKARKIEERTVFIIEYQDKVTIRKHPPKGLLASLCELPNIEGKASEEAVSRVLGLGREQVGSVEQLPEVKHVFSYMEWHMTGYRVVLSKEESPLSCFTVSREDLEQAYALPNAFSAYTRLIG